MSHKTVYEAFGCLPDELARQLGNLRYDELGTLLYELSEKIEVDAAADKERGRPQLAAALDLLSVQLDVASINALRVWSICAPHMESQGADNRT